MNITRFFKTLFVILFVCSTLSAQTNAPQGYPVVLHYDTITVIYNKLGTLNAQERAETSSRKILQAAEVFIHGLDTLAVIDSGETTDVVFGETVLISVSERDSQTAGLSREEMANSLRRRINESIVKYEHNTGIVGISRMIGLSLLVVCGIVVLFFFVNMFFRRFLDRKIVNQKNRLFKGIRFRTLEIMNADKQVAFALFVSKIMRFVVYLLLLYLALPILFSIFPMTQRFAHTLLDWLINPLKTMLLGIISYLPKFVKIIIIIVIFRYIIRFLRYISNEIGSGRMKIQGFYPDWAKATFNIIRILLFAFAFVLIFPLLPNSDSEIFKYVSMFLGVIVSIGSTSIVGNMVAGLVITYMRPFKVGDRIRVGEVFGDVMEKTPFVIRVKTIKKEIITVPNLTILSSNVINYSTEAESEGVILYSTITMGYEVPQTQVYSLLIAAALKTEHILSEPAPFVFSLELGDNAASYQINAYTRHPELQASIYSELNRNILDAFHEAGIEMIIPHYRAVRDGNGSTLPQDKA
jgi:small-conductance mechanosensitive channel